MSNFTNLNEIFHIFSKTPVADGQTLASARNKSGHTVTTSDVWAEDIPAFFSAPTQSHIDNLKTIAKDNDLCYDETKKSIFYFKEGKWTSRGELKDGELLANYEASKLGIYNDGSLNDESKAVVKYYLNKEAIAIDGNNNNTADGNRYTARIAKGSSFVPQFVSSMDKIVNGNPSTYYEPVVNEGDITEDIADKGTTTKYIANNYSGIIQFHKQMEKTSDGKLKNITISAFEYIGDTLDEALETKIPSVASLGTQEKGLSLSEVTSDDKLYHYLSLATAYYETAADKDPTWVNKEYLITANEVEKFVNLTVDSLEDRIDNLQKAGISYKIYIPTKDAPLPEPSIEYKNIILLVPEEQKYQDYMPPSAISGGYVEWLCVNKGTDEAPSWAWEQIGTTKADLKDYIKVVELNNKLLKVKKNESNYVKLGSLVEDVATTYNSLAGSYVVENGVTQKYQSFNASGVPNCGSISVGISKKGEIAIGVQTATDEVYGLSKMFTGDLSTTPSTETYKAVSVKSAQAMYNSLASGITYDKFDIPTFDLNYILQSKINEPWVEEMVITSSDYALQIPYKETHYGTGDTYFNSLNKAGFYTLSEPISEEEYNSGIKHRPIATINKTEDGEYDLTTIYNFPDSPYSGLTEIEYENLKNKIKEALDETLKGQLKTIEDSFNNAGFSYIKEENPYKWQCENTESDIQQKFTQWFSMGISMSIYIPTDKLIDVDENYKNFIIKITTPAENITQTEQNKDQYLNQFVSENNIELTIINSGSSNITLSSVAKDALRKYIHEASSNYKVSALTDWVKFLSKVGREAAYKAKWIEDAKNNTIKTPLAFRYQVKTTYDLFRLILIKLLGEEQYGEESSLSKKYMKPGITFTCLTRPYDRIGLTTSHYYSYVKNTWKGNPSGNYHDEVYFKNGDINWSYIPSLYTLNNTATYGSEDYFAHPTNWDTTTNEQKFDCLVDEVTRNKDDINDLTVRFENSIPAIESYTTKSLKANYTYQSDISGSIDAAGNCYGICYVPKTNVKVTSIQINQINNGVGTSATNINNCYIKVFAKDETGSWKLVANSPNHQISISGPQSIKAGTYTQNYWSNTWNIQGAGLNQGSDFIAKEGVEYHITLNDNNNVDSYQTGYSMRMCMYRNSSNDYVLGSNVNHNYTSFTPNFIIEGESVEMTVTSETVYPTHLYGEFLNNKHDISHKYDKTNNVVSFNDGIISFSDGTERYFDVQKAIIAKYLFRGDSSSTITEFNTRKEFDTWLNNRAHCNDFYYEYDCYVTEKDSQGNDQYVYDDDIDSSTGRPTLSTLQNVINGKNLFLRSQLTKFNDDLSCLMNGFQMFASSNKLESFRSALPSLTNGIKMFIRCSALTRFETKLPNLVLAECMFRYATALTEINTCLPNLTHARGMFMYCSNLSKVRFSKNSFQCLYNGCDMFNGCSSLTSFHYELPYLETADDMFLDCKLDLESVKIIAESLYNFGTKDSNGYAEDGRKHVITFGVADGVAAQATQYKTLMENKGWVVEGI